MNKNAIILFALFLSSCLAERLFDGPNTYSDDFEQYNSTDDLIDGQNENWSFFQQTYQDNTIALDTTQANSGKTSVRCTAIQTPGTGNVSKASINKHQMAFWEGETMLVEASYYIEGTMESDWLFLLDIEENVPIGAGPGMRIALVDNLLLVEHKFPNPNIRQPENQEIPFPRDQWVRISAEIKLSRKKQGYIKVWQDGSLIIEQFDWKTLPSDLLYFQQGTKGMYTNVEFGITANTKDNEMSLFVDDVDVRVLD